MLTMGQSVATHSPTSAVVSSVLVLLLLGVIDYDTGPKLSFSVFYLVPVSFAAWFAGKRTGTFVGCLAGLIWLAADVASTPGHMQVGPALWNLSSRVCTLVFIAQIMAHVRSLHLGLEDTVAKRTHQLQIETSRRVAMEREIAAVSHREQQRIARELHDGLGQELGALAFQAKLLASRLNHNGSTQAQEAQRLVEVINRSTARTRALSHLLDPLGEGTGALRHALGLLADQSGQAFGIACTFESPDSLPHLSADAELNLYRITQEAIHNAVQHGRASEVAIVATADPGQLTLRISDNGRGFFPAKPTDLRPGMGLRIMRYRADALHADLDIRSAQAKGCTVLCSVPLRQTEA
jgi:signal transduction histidine kinase